MTTENYTPRSLWRETAPPAPSLTGLAADIAADVVVVGAGYTGLSTALHLAEAGVSVVVLEAAEVGHGGSGRNNGQVIPSLTRPQPEDLVNRFGNERGERLALLVRDSAKLVFDLIRRHGIACDAVQNGWLQPAHTPGRFEKVTKPRFEQWRRRGADVELLDGAEVERLTGARGYHGAWLGRTGGHVNPLAFARGLAAAVLAAGGRIFIQSPVTAIGKEGSSWRVRTETGSVTAGQVVIATNAYTRGLWPPLGRSIVPIRSFQMATEPLPDAVRRAVLPEGQALSDTHGDLWFFRPTADGRIVTGGALFLHHDWENRLKRRIGERLCRAFPAFKAPPRFDYVWHGDLAMTPEHLPRLHRLAPGVHTVLGYCGRGLALSTALGPVLAVLAQGVSEAALPLPFAPMHPFPFHAVVSKLARFELLRYRWLDSKEV